MQWRHYMQRLLHHFREFFGRSWLSWVLVISRGYLFQISWFSFAVFAIGEGVVISRRILQGWEVLRGGFLLVELLFRGWFSVLWRIIEVPTCWRRITKAPACWWRITKAPACCWRIIEASTCLVGGLSSFLLVWLALQVLLLAAEGGFNWFFNRYCSRLCGRLFGVIYAAFP